MATHSWTAEDEILALALYVRRKRYPPNDSVIMQLQTFLEQRDISSGALGVKLGYFEALDRGEKPAFGRISQQTRAVWDEYQGEPFILQRDAKDILNHEFSPERRDDLRAQ